MFYRARILNLLVASIAISFAAPSLADTIEGFTEPYRMVDLAAGDAGVIAKLGTTEGDHVDVGAEIASLDNSVYDASLAIARKKAKSTSNIEVAQAEFNLHSQRLEQIRMLRSRGHATNRELSRAEADVAVASARLQHAHDERTLNELDCKRIEAQIAQRRIISPFSGVVIKLHRKQGEPTLVTDPQIVTLAQLDKLRVKFPAMPRQLQKLSENQQVKLQLADTGKTIDATIERIAKTIDAKSGTVEIHAVIDNSQSTIRSGARCMLTVEADYAETAGGDQPQTDTKPVSQKRGKQGFFK